MRRYGVSPFTTAVVHGGPGAGGEMAPVARQLAPSRGVLEPIQTATSLEGQIEELSADLRRYGDPPMVLIGFSWGAWLSLLIAARYPQLVRKLILVGSGPFEEAAVAQLQRTRNHRLSEQDRAALIEIVQALEDPETQGKDAHLARLGVLTEETDAYDPIRDRREAADRMGPRADIFQAVWQEAAALRKSGELLRLAGSVRCPVVAIHGDYDPHPAEGVRQPLDAVLDCFHFVLLDHCGHKPWIERQARATFFRVLEDELS